MPHQEATEADTDARLAAARRLDLEHFLPYRLSVLTNRISQSLAREYEARFGLTVPEWRTMAVLGCYQPLSATEVGERTSMDKVKVSRAVAAMVAKGLVVREGHPQDQRMRKLSLSAEGLAMHAEIAALALLDRLQERVARLAASQSPELDPD